MKAFKVFIASRSTPAFPIHLNRKSLLPIIRSVDRRNQREAGVACRSAVIAGSDDASVNSTCLIGNIHNDFRFSEHWDPLDSCSREIKFVQIDFPEILVVIRFEVNNMMSYIPKCSPLSRFLKDGLLIRHCIGYQTEWDIKCIVDMLGKIKRSFSARLYVGEPGQNRKTNKSARGGEVTGKTEHS